MTKTVDVSGFTDADAPAGCVGPRAVGGYEWGCQIIKARALRWLRENGIERELPALGSYKNVYGLMWPANKSAEMLEHYALDHPSVHGATGAMVQASLGHAIRQFQLGDEAYFRQFEAEPGRVFEFDDSLAFGSEGK